jgi:hypothetical protein
MSTWPVYVRWGVYAVLGLTVSFGVLQSPAPWISSSGDIQPNNRTYRVVYVKPSADCGDEATCGRCLSKPTGKLDLDSSEDYGNFVILLHEDDFPCFLGHSEFSKVSLHATALPLCCLFRCFCLWVLDRRLW